MQYLLETHDIRTCITTSVLRKLNSKAIRGRYARSLKPELLDVLPDARFAVLDLPGFEWDNETTRLTLSLPIDPTEISRGFTLAWLDVRNTDVHQLIKVWVPKRSTSVAEGA